MTAVAVVKSGGKQYLVKSGMEIVVDKIEGEVGEKIELVTLMRASENGDKIELGTPELKKKASGEIVESGKGEKIRVARFRAKTRYRKVKGHRSLLTKVKILSI